MNDMTIFSIMFCLGGFIPLIPLKDFRKRRAKFQEWRKAKAVVYDISYDSNGDKPSAYPKYRFSNGMREYKGMTSYGVSLRKYKVGDDIEILFNPFNPDESDAPGYFSIGPFTLSAYDFFIIACSTLSALCFAAGIISAILIVCGKSM